MVKRLVLNTLKRGDESENSQKLRQDGFIPAVVYGGKNKNISLKIKKIELQKAYEQAGESTLIDLKIDDAEPVKVIFKEVQKNVLSNSLEHVDFYQVDMNKPIEIEIPLNFIGEPKAVRELGGTLVKNIETVNARCLPNDLIENIDVDLSGLDTFDDSVKVESLKCPDTIEILAQPTDLIASVLQPRLIEEEEEESEEAEGEEAKEGEEGGDDAKDSEKSDKAPEGGEKKEEAKEKK